MSFSNKKYIVQIYDVAKQEAPFEFKTLGELSVNVPDLSVSDQTERLSIIGRDLRRNFSRDLHFLSSETGQDGITRDVIVACLTYEEYPHCMLGHFGCECKKR
jgi:hypothetical protein